LPAAEDSREQEDLTAGGVAPVARGGELDKLKAERDRWSTGLARGYKPSSKTPASARP